jgi:glycosyltransferase involved in cell wall biosynthesis
MKVALIARSTLYKVQGGITVQVVETAKHLQKLGIDAVICLANERIDYEQYDLLHFFDVIRPANILNHIKKSKKPFVITPILLDYSEYDKQFRKGISGFIFRMFSTDTNEYIKTILRWLLRKDRLPSKTYLWMGQKRSIQYILRKSKMVLPNSQKEYEALVKTYGIERPYTIIPNGVNEKIFHANGSAKDAHLVLCVATIEGRKNQFNLIKALNDTHYRLLLIGDAAPNQQTYYQECRESAAKNIEFIGQLSQEELAGYYSKAKVHVLPSWFETCGLSSLEAAAMGCNIVITDKGYTRDYFGDEAFYCDPENTDSIYVAVQNASNKAVQKKLQEQILSCYTWPKAATATLEAYKKIL